MNESNPDKVEKETTDNDIGRKKNHIEKIKQFKKLALGSTEPSDWLNHNGIPYLTEVGCDKLLSMFNISVEITNIPTLNYYKDGHFEYVCKGRFHGENIYIDAIGAKSSKDPFYTAYYDKSGTKQYKKPEAIDKTNIMKHSVTNCTMNGLTRILGLRGLSFDDLKNAGIDIGQIQNIGKRKKGATPNAGSPDANKITDAQIKYARGLIEKLALKKTKVIEIIKKLFEKEIKAFGELTKQEAMTFIKHLKTIEEDNEKTKQEAADAFGDLVDKKDITVENV